MESSTRKTLRAQPQDRLPGDTFSLDDRLKRHFAKLATLGVQPDGSISRIAYSDAESSAIGYIRAEGEAFGLEGRYDAVGNLVLSLPGNQPRRLLVGSHLDSVPRGGNYDGSAGIVAGLEALRDLSQEAEELEVGIDLVVWRGEEYTFDAVYKGSAAAFGLAETHILFNTYEQQTLRDAIWSQGFTPDPIDVAQPTFSLEEIDSIVGYYELHIEQGVRLEREQKDLGIVTSIAGDRRFLIVLHGRFDHSGATPMGRAFRSDVNLTMAHIQTRADQLAKERRGQGREFVQTVGVVNADPDVDRKHPAVHANSVTKVSGLGYFTLDIMGPDDDFLDAYSGEVHRLIWQTAKEYGVTANIEQTDRAGGVNALDPGLRKHLHRAIESLGHSYLEMPSGAGHDAALVAQVRRSDGSPIPVSMLFVPCRDGISHSKEEYVTPGQMVKGTQALRDAMRRVATGGKTP